MIGLITYLPFVLIFALLGVYAERKVSAYIQDRMGPVEVGPKGLLQTAADILKLMMKEGIIPQNADKFLFNLAPFVVFTAIFAAFAVMPFTPSIVGSNLEVGVFYFLAIVSLDVIGILIAGWGSNNKYSLYGAMRSAAQMVSYEIPLGLAVLTVIMTAQSMNMADISQQQGIWWEQGPIYLFDLKVLGIDISGIGGFLTWNIFRNPLLMVSAIMFFIASLAQSNRTPFDIPEAESELIAGFHIEYSGIRFAFLMLSEYASMLLMSLATTIFFLGSWNTPLPNIGPVALADWTSGAPGSLSGELWGVFWLFSKAIFLVFVQMWIRWTFPRLRVDQLMSLCWKYLTPIGLVLIFLVGIWKLI